MYVRDMEDTRVTIHLFIIEPRGADLFARARGLEITGSDPAATALP